MSFNLSLSKALLKAYTVLIYLGVFLTPLFFSPLGLLDLDKQTLLLSTIFLAFLCWVFLQVLEGRVAIRFSRILFLPFPFLVALIISTIFSKFTWGSFWGFPQDSSFNLLNFILWMILLYLLASTFESNSLKNLLKLIGISWQIVMLWSLISLFYPVSIPTPFGSLQVGSPVGSLLSEAILTGILFPLYLGFILEKRRAWRVVGALGCLLCLGFLGVVSYKVSWLLAFFTSASLLFLCFLKVREISRHVFVATSFFFALSFVMSFFNIPLPQPVSLPVYVSPSWSWNLSIAQKVWQESVASLLFGWGPGSFRYAWSQFRPQEVLNTLVWNLRFTRPSGEIFNIAINTGVVGIVSFSVMVLSWVIFSIKNLLSGKGEEKEGFGFVLPAILTGFFASLFVTSFNLVTWTLFWVFGGFLLGMSSEKVRLFNLSVQGLANVVFSFLSVLALVSGISLFYLQGARVYAKVLELLAINTPDPQEADNLYLTAVSFSNKDESILQNGALYFFNRAQGELSRQDLKDEEKGRRVGTLIGNSVALINRAVNVNPANVVNWETRGFLYRQIIGLAQGAENFAVNSYEEALKREPDNPYFYLELGRTYLSMAQREENNQKKADYFAKAEENLKKAIELKRDYTPAYYQMAALFEAQGKRKEAIQSLEDLKDKASTILALDPAQRLNLSFQLGVLYYNDGQYEKAKRELEQVISASPNFSNALYFLALSEAKLGQKDSAIARLEKVKELNKENTSVVERIDKIVSNIKEGKDPLEGVSQQRVQESLEKKPEEQ